MASNANPFASDVSSLHAMLINAFGGGGGFQPPPAPALNYMGIPTMQQEQTDFIDLGAGGPAPGSARSNGLTDLGGAMGQIGQAVGSAMAANQAANIARGQDALKSVGVNAGGFRPGQNPLDYLQYSPAPASNPFK